MFRNRRFIDIAINLTDCVFFGIDRKGKKIHESDIDLVIARAISAGVERLILTGTDLEVSSKAISMCRLYPGKCFCTVGIHPAHSDVFLSEATKESILAAIPKKQVNKNKKSQQAPAGTNSNNNTVVSSTSSADSSPPSTISIDPAIATQVMSQLREMVLKNRDVVVAIGECGLDYAEISPLVTPNLQAQGFQLQAALAKELNIPLLLHSRDCGMDFVKEMKIAFPEENTRPHNNSNFEMMKGVTHSFNGSAEELDSLLKMKSIKNYFGVNASAFREESVAKVVALMIPEDRLMIETDAPWCAPKLGDWGYAVANRFVLREDFSEGETESKNNTADRFAVDDGKPWYDIAGVVDKSKFEMGKRVDKRNEPCTLPAVFAQLCLAKGLLENDERETLLTKGDELAARIYQNVLDAFFCGKKEMKNKDDDDE